MNILQDLEIPKMISREYARQMNSLELIASENIVSKAVLEAQGSVLTNKYAEGYPGRRYYGGCHIVDEIETLAIERLKLLFGCEYANVQPHSGSQANQAVFLAILKPGDTILGMSLAAGGHLTHGATPNLSGKWFNAISYGVRPDDFTIDYEQVEALAIEHKPKLIIAGGSAYPRKIDFARFKAISEKVGAYLLADVAHYSGLIAGLAYPSPFPAADIVTSTTHKTLRGPRGGVIMTNSEELNKKINSAVFPGLQGGPLMHVIAAKAVCFFEAMQDQFKTYAINVINNAQILANCLKRNNIPILTDGTDSHIVLLDLRPLGVTGKYAEHILELAGMTCNKNTIPFDTEKPTITSGIRLGTAACTTRGLGPGEWETVGTLISEILMYASKNKEIDMDDGFIQSMQQKVMVLCRKFPIFY